MTSRLCGLLISCTALGAVWAQAQTDKLTPTALSVEPIPQMAHYLISLQPLNAPIPPPPPAKAPDRAKTVDITRTKNIEHVEITMTSGARKALWVMGQTIYTQVEDGSFDNRTVSAEGDPGYLRLGEKFFYGTDWVRTENYQGEKPYQNAPCYYYETSSPKGNEGRSPAGEDPALSQPPLWRAWINEKTGLPVAVQVSGLIAVYQFLDAPTGMLSLPQVIIDDNKKANDALQERIRQSQVR